MTLNEDAFEACTHANNPAEKWYNRSYSILQPKEPNNIE